MIALDAEIGPKTKFIRQLKTHQLMATWIFDLIEFWVAINFMAIHYQCLNNGTIYDEFFYDQHAMLKHGRTIECATKNELFYILLNSVFIAWDIYSMHI